MILLSVAASRCLANAAAVATAMASSTTTAEAQAVANVLLILSQRPDLATDVLKLGAAAGANLNVG